MNLELGGGVGKDAELLRGMDAEMDLRGWRGRDADLKKKDVEDSKSHFTSRGISMCP